MVEEIREVHARLKEALASFDDTWPALIEDGVVWRLPLLAEQKTPDFIPVERLVGEDAVSAARQAFIEFKRDIGQAPGTVMRLPGFFVLNQSVLDQVRHINQLKDELIEAVEITRLELNLVKSARPRILRSALGPGLSMMQLSRHIQVFDAPPRLIVFTWAGHTAGAEKVRVGAVRELLRSRAQTQASAANCPIEQTPAALEARVIANMADQDVLHRYKKLAAHPRVMLWFSEKTRYDAMVHASLPIFVRASDSGDKAKLRELGDFDSNERQAERPDRKPRIAVIPRMNLYLPAEQKSSQKPAFSGIENVHSTYNRRAIPNT